MRNYVFTGFKQADTVRHLAFDCVDDDRSKSSVIVHADVTLARKHAILIQDLPLLCRRLLETAEGATPVSMTFTEANMVAAEMAGTKPVVYRKPQKRVTGPNRIGQAWR